tara:strand:- start:394 stop:657 length:264 start_codon:yes stop_codon:yes gene_type:complete
MIAQKFTESIADVMRYIVNAEMGGLVDYEHHLYPTYLDLKDMFEQVKSQNETLDLQSHAVLKGETNNDRYENHPEEVYNRNWMEANL